MRRLLTILVLTTALVATLATPALAIGGVPCAMGCTGIQSATR